MSYFSIQPKEVLCIIKSLYFLISGTWHRWRHLRGRTCPRQVRGDHGRPGRCDGLPPEHGLLRQAVRGGRHVLHRPGPHHPTDPEGLLQPPGGRPGPEAETHHTGDSNLARTDRITALCPGGEWGERCRPGIQEKDSPSGEDRQDKPRGGGSQQVQTGNWGKDKGIDTRMTMCTEPHLFLKRIWNARSPRSKISWRKNNSSTSWWSKLKKVFFSFCIWRSSETLLS